MPHEERQHRDELRYLSERSRPRHTPAEDGFPLRACDCSGLLVRQQAVFTDLSGRGGIINRDAVGAFLIGTADDPYEP